MDQFTRAQLSYDAMLARGPREDSIFTVSVEYTIFVGSGFTLESLTKVVGGEAHFSADVDEDGYREVGGSTILDEIADEEDGQQVMRNLLTQVAHVDLDSAEITVTGPSADDFIDPED